MIKSIKIMLLPNDKQQSKPNQTASVARYAYNWTVATQIQPFEQNKKYKRNSVSCSAKFQENII